MEEGKEGYREEGGGEEEEGEGEEKEERGYSFKTFKQDPTNFSPVWRTEMGIVPLCWCVIHNLKGRGGRGGEGGEGRGGEECLEKERRIEIMRIVCDGK